MVTRLKEPLVELHKYEGKNYSFEFDQEGRLFSILVAGLTGFPPRPPKGPSLVDFKRALEQKDVDGLITLLMPDVEIFRGSEVIRYAGAARAELSNPKSKISEVLYSAPHSLRDIFMNEKPTGNLELRVYSERKTMGMVFKFPESKEISEIVFDNFAGSWRVWEVTFKQNTIDR